MNDYQHFICMLPECLLYAELFSQCKKGEVAKVEALIQYRSLDIHHQNDEAFRIACAESHLDLIDFLLTSKTLKSHANMCANNNEPIVWACITNNTRVIYHLIVNYGIEKKARKFLKSIHRHHIVYDILKLKAELKQLSGITCHKAASLSKI